MADDPDVYGRHHSWPWEATTALDITVFAQMDRNFLRGLDGTGRHRREPGDFVTPALHAAMLNSGRTA